MGPLKCVIVIEQKKWDSKYNTRFKRLRILKFGTFTVSIITEVISENQRLLTLKLISNTRLSHLAELRTSTQISIKGYLVMLLKYCSVPRWRCGAAVCCADPASDPGSSPEAQLRLKRARLAEDLNEKLALRPGPLELVQKNIIPLDSAVAMSGTSGAGGRRDRAPRHLPHLEPRDSVCVCVY